MSSLTFKKGVYVARFRYHGRQYSKSLRTTNRVDAQGVMAVVQLTLHRLMVGLVCVPDGIDPGDYIISGGTRKVPRDLPKVEVVPAVAGAVTEYLANLAHMAETNRGTIAVHLRNFQQALGAVKTTSPLDRIGPRDLEAFLQSRLRDRSPTTVAKERATLVAFFAWAVSQGYLPKSPADRLTRIKQSGGLPAFRTYAEVEGMIARGGMTPEQEWALWDCLYLSPA